MRKRRTPRKVNSTFVVVVDDKTEMWYLKMLQQNERDLRITIKPEIPKHKNIGVVIHAVNEGSTRLQ